MRPRKSPCIETKPGNAHCASELPENAENELHRCTTERCRAVLGRRTISPRGGRQPRALPPSRRLTFLLLSLCRSLRRPNNIVFGRMFDFHVLDLLEVGVREIDPTSPHSTATITGNLRQPAHPSKPGVVHFSPHQVENYRGIREFGGVGSTSQLGGKPLMVFTGELFETDDVRLLPAAKPSSHRQSFALSAPACFVVALIVSAARLDFDSSSTCQAFDREACTSRPLPPQVYKLARNILLDFFRGRVVPNINLKASSCSQL